MKDTPVSRALVVLGGVAIVLGASIALYALTDPAGRPDLLTRVGTIGPMVAVLVPSILAWLNSKEAADKTKAMAKQVDHIEQEVNSRMGELIAQNGGSRDGDVQDHHAP